MDRMRYGLLTALALTACTLPIGCGTTQWSDTSRTATEQLLISDAMDRAVSRLDFCAVAGKMVYVDTTPLQGVTDSTYLTSLIRQHMLAAGCILKEKLEEADYVVEVRAGAVGTDRRDVMFGVPATKVPALLPLPGTSADLPEVRLAEKIEQRAVAKIAVFAYNRKTGRPVWQSGAVPVESKIKNISILGAGPFERGSIIKGTKFAGSKIKIPLIDLGNKDEQSLVSVSDEAYFAEPKELGAEEQQLASDDQTPNAEPATSENGTSENGTSENGTSENGTSENGTSENAIAKKPTAEKEKPRVAEQSTPPAASGGVVHASHSQPIAQPAAPNKSEPASGPASGPPASKTPKAPATPKATPAREPPTPAATTSPAPQPPDTLGPFDDVPLSLQGGPAPLDVLRKTPAAPYLLRPGP